MSGGGRVPIALLPTGVPGLDEILGGGLPEYSFNLIAGTPGAGKTTLAHQIMFALASPARPALYFTLIGEPPLKMLRYQQQLSFFDLAKVVEQSKDNPVFYVQYAHARAASVYRNVQDVFPGLGVAGPGSVQLQLLLRRATRVRRGGDPLPGLECTRPRNCPD